MLQVWTDGSVEPNPGVGGWGFVMTSGDRVVLEEKGGAALTTNNRMEMTAALEGMRRCPASSKPEVISDSQYVVNGCTIWRKGWEKKGYKKKGSDILNSDLWRALHAEIDRTKATFRWVRGHSGIGMNERADHLANMGRLSVQTIPSDDLLQSAHIRDIVNP